MCPKVFKFIVRKTQKLPECTKIFYFIPETLSSKFYSRLSKEDTIESYIRLLYSSLCCFPLILLLPVNLHQTSISGKSKKRKEKYTSELTGISDQ